MTKKIIILALLVLAASIILRGRPRPIASSPLELATPSPDPYCMSAYPREMHSELLQGALPEGEQCYKP